VVLSGFDGVARVFGQRLKAKTIGPQRHRGAEKEYFQTDFSLRLCASAANFAIVAFQALALGALPAAATGLGFWRLSSG